MENRNALISTKYGEGALQIASLNADSLRKQEAIYSAINNIITNNIDIACIQETHNERIDIVQIIIQSFLDDL